MPKIVTHVIILVYAGLPLFRVLLRDLAEPPQKMPRRKNGPGEDSGKTVTYS
jgi:hypothetical protein